MKHNLRKNLSQNVQRLSEKNNLSLGSLADLANISRSQIYNVVREDKAATIDLLQKLGEAFDKAPWDLLKPV
jgi:predicted transcriptional regulator